MAIESNLVSQIPLPSQNWQTKSNVPAVASVKVSDVEDDTPHNTTVVQNKSNGFFEKINRYRPSFVKKMPEVFVSCFFLRYCA